MPNLHQRSAQKLKGMVVQDLLDRFPPVVRKEVGEERGFYAAESSATTGWGAATGKAMEMSGVQSTKG